MQRFKHIVLMYFSDLKEFESQGFELVAVDPNGNYIMKKPVPVIQAWEYRVLTGVKPAISLLDMFGQDGWELIQMRPSARQGEFTLHFKRPKTAPDTDTGRNG